MSKKIERLGPLDPLLESAIWDLYDKINELVDRINQLTEATPTDLEAGNE